MTNNIAIPDKAMAEWQDLERLQFIHLDPATWQGRQHDNLSFPVKDIDPSRLDTDQWCRAAISWGAKLILFVAKHTGGFCWWQTGTTDYSIRSTSYKEGKGDVLKELSESCKRFGLKLGIYVYSGDISFGAFMGGGGRTVNPANQEKYNSAYRQQLTEVLSRYGRIDEIWFDGGIIIPVQDIIKKYAPDAVIFQGPERYIRWVGNEKGEIPYPAWSTIRRDSYETFSSTAFHSDADGEVYSPMEADTTIYDHWFWNKEVEKSLKSLNLLMETYYKSAGRGGVLLLNASPTTSGLIEENAMKRSKEFGAEICRRFVNPLAETSGTGMILDLTLGKAQEVNHVVIMEDFRKGERIREYAIESKNNGKWSQIGFGAPGGTHVGRKHIDIFLPVTTNALRLKITKAIGEPQIRSFAAYNVSGINIVDLISKLNGDVEVHKDESGFKTCGAWAAEYFGSEWTALDIDLSFFLKEAGQYELNFTIGSNTPFLNSLEIKETVLMLEGNPVLGLVEKHKTEPGIFYINRTAVTQGDGEEKTVFRLIAKSKAVNANGKVCLRARR